MNKWSLLLFPVLWLLQSATSERIFVDGRHGRFDYSSRPFLPGKICADQHCNEFSDLTVPTRDIRFSNRYVLLKQTSSLNHHPEQRRLSSGNSDRVFSNVPNRFDVNTFMRNIGNSKFERNLRSVSRKIYGDNRVDRTPYNNNDRIAVKMEDIRERGIDFEQEQILSLRSRNIRNYRRSAHRDDRVARNSRDIRNDERCSINIDSVERLNVVRRTYEVSDEMLVRGRDTVTRFETRRFTPSSFFSNLRFTQGENERAKNRRSFENRQKDERYSNRRLREARINSLQELMPVRMCTVSSFLKNGDHFRYVSHYHTEQPLEQDRIRRIRDDSSQRQREETFAERLMRTNRDNVRTAENGLFGRLDRRNQVIRRTVSERRQSLDGLRDLLVSEGRRINDQTRIRQVGKRTLANIQEETRDIRRIKDQVFEKMLERKHNNRNMLGRYDRNEINILEIRSTQISNRNPINNDNAPIDNRQREESNTNQRLMRKESHVRRFSPELRSRTYNENLLHRVRDDSSHVGTEQQNKDRIRLIRNSRERSEESNGKSLLRKREVTVSNIGIHRPIEAVTSNRIALNRHQDRKQFRFASVFERENDFNLRKEPISTKDRFNRNIYDKDSTRNNNRNKLSKNYRERLTLVEERSSYIQVNPHELENRMQKEERLSCQIDTRRKCNRIGSTERQEKTYTEILFERKDDVKENAIRRNERASDENRNKQMRTIREFSSIQKRDTERYLTRNRNNVLENRVDRARLEYGDLQNKVTERVLALLKYKEDGSSSNADRNFGQKRNSLDGNRPLLTRNEDNRIAARRELRCIDENADIRDVRNRVTARPTISEDVYGKTNRGLQNRQTARNMKATVENKSIPSARINVRKSINPLRDLEDTNKESNSYRYNKDIMTRVRQNENLDRSRSLISNSRSERIYRSLLSTKTREEERRYRTALTTLGYDALEIKNPSDNRMFVMKWQYVFYLLQAFYILGLFAKQMNVSGENMKPRFADCILPLSILKLN